MFAVVRTSCTLTILAVVSFLLVSAPAHGQCPELQKLVASNAAGGDDFGTSTAIDGKVAVVGAPDHDSQALADSGAAYVFTESGGVWSETQILDAGAFAIAGAGFGSAVGISGDWIVVGAQQDNAKGNDSGAAYVFENIAGTWTLKQQLVGSNLAAGDNFGNDVDIDGDALIVGAVWDDTTGGVDAGSAYVFRYDGPIFGWTEEAVLEDSVTSDWFGIRVALDGDVAVVGSILDNHSIYSDGGSAYVYRHDGGGSWPLEDMLISPSPYNGARFGEDVAVYGDVVVCGEWRGGIGRAHTYRLNQGGGTWDFEQTLEPANGATNDQAAERIDLNGSVIVIGVRLDDHAGATNNGSAYVYRWCPKQDAWIEDDWMAASDTANFDEYGYAVAVSGDVALIGAHLDNDAATDSGSAYVMSVAELGLSASDTSLSVGESFDLDVYCGPPGNLVDLAVIDVDGTPTFLSVLFAVFGANHQVNLKPTTPPGLGGLDVTLMALTIRDCGKVVLSNPVTLSFL